jgi:F0F1-type ATP synthase assembly protein I
MSAPRKPDQPLTLYTVAVSTVGQVGCLLFITIGGFLGVGLLLDRLFATKHLFLIIFLLGSIPLNLWLIYRYTLYKARSLQASSTQAKEENLSEN